MPQIGGMCPSVTLTRSTEEVVIHTPALDFAQHMPHLLADPQQSNGTAFRVFLAARYSVRARSSTSNSSRLSPA